MKYNPVIVANWFRSVGLPEPQFEVRFHPSRKWRWDLAWVPQLVALEIDGGIWIRGGHNRGAQMKKDWEKANCGQLMGWKVFRCEPRDLTTMATADMIRGALGL